jgi:hypothetical protein
MLLASLPFIHLCLKRVHNFTTLAATSSDGVLWNSMPPDMYAGHVFAGHSNFPNLLALTGHQ